MPELRPQIQSLTSPTPAPSITVDTIFVTPEMAERWLERNTHNRPVCDSHLARLEADFSSGRYRFNGDPIRFGPSPESVLLDGQHRLWAVFNTGIGQWMVVQKGIEPSAAVTMDQGRTRGASDVAKFCGIEMTRRDQEVVNSMIRGHRTGGALPSQSWRLEFFQRHAEVVRLVNGLIPRRRTFGQAAVRGVLARASYHLPATVVERYAEVFITGVSRDPVDTTIIRLRDWLLNGSARSGTGAAHQAVYTRMEHNVAAFFEGRVVGRVTAAKEELFPLPEEQF